MLIIAYQAAVFTLALLVIHVSIRRRRVSVPGLFLALLFFVGVLVTFRSVMAQVWLGDLLASLSAHLIYLGFHQMDERNRPPL